MRNSGHAATNHARRGTNLAPAHLRARHDAPPRRRSAAAHESKLPIRRAARRRAGRPGEQARMQGAGQWSGPAAAGGRACAGGRPTSSATRSTSGSVSSPPEPCPSGE
jgi:hypothetical protein